jgi:hypothetical protein
MGSGIVALPIAFTTDAAGAVVTTTVPGNCATVIKVPATTGRYRILLGRTADRPDRYKSLYHCEPGISSTNYYGIRLRDEDVAGVTPYVEIEVGVPSPSFVVSLGVPDAAAVDSVHAALAGTAAVAFPGPITNPDVPRVVSATFAAGWDGGDITVVGTDAFGAAQTETLVAVAGTTVTGAAIFATVTSITKSLVGVAADAVTIGCGDVLGLPAPLSDAVGILLCDDVVEVAPTFDATEHSVAVITATDGVNLYKAAANFAADPVAADPVSATIGATLWLEG